MVRPDDLAVPALVVRPAGHAEGLGGPRLCDGQNLRRAGRFYERGVLQGKRAFLSLTTGGLRDLFLQDGFHGDIHGILKPIHRGMLQFVGFDVLAPHIVYGPARMSDEQRNDELARFGVRLRRIAEERPIEVGRYSG